MRAVACLASLLLGWGFGAGAPPVVAAPVIATPTAATPAVGVAGQAAPAESRYQVFLLTMDQGDEVWERFGHNALVILDSEDGTQLAWNWGLFDFEEVDFIPRFLRGTMRYRMGPSEVDPLVNAYAAANRSVYANEVFLTQEEARALDEFVRWNYLPENREYTYHYYFDNCSTRVRDALDLVLGGMLRERFEGNSTPYSFRWHSRRLVEETLWVDQGLSFLLGMRGDHPRTEWEAMFIPMELMELLEGVTRTDGAGGEVPLLGPRRVLYEADREPAPESPSGFSPLWILLGLGGAGTMIGLGGAAGRGASWARALLAAYLAVWGLAAGGLGWILFLAWFTDHEFIQRNLNIVYMNPLLVLLGGLAAAVTSRPVWLAGGPGRAAALLALGIAAASGLTALLQLTPFLHQGNPEPVAVALPINLAIAWVLLRCTALPVPALAGRTWAASPRS